MQTPLHLSDEEVTVLLTLAGPINQQLRLQFLQEVAAELEASRQAGEIGEGSVHRLARAIQRRFLEPAPGNRRKAESYGRRDLPIACRRATTRVSPSTSLKTAGYPAFTLQVG